MSLIANSQPVIELQLQEFEEGLIVKARKKYGDLKPQQSDTENAVVEGTTNEEVCYTLHSLMNASIDLSKITVVNLSNCDITQLPDSFTSLPIQLLDVSHNRLTSVPKCIEDGLAFIETLNLSYNHLDAFANMPRCVRKLQILDLTHNNLLNIPDWVLLMQAINLREFSYSNNRVSSLRQSRFHQHSMLLLNKLELRNCKLWEGDFKRLKDVYSLEILDISNEELYKGKNSGNANNFRNCDALFDNPSWEKVIRVINLNNLLILYVPDMLANFEALEELYLANNGLVALPSTLVKLVNLRVLDFGANKVMYLPANVCNLVNLEKILAPFNNLSNFPTLALFPKLQVLDLYANEIDCDVGNFISSSIIYIDLEQNYLDTQILLNYWSQKTLFREKIQDRFDGAREIIENDSGQSSSPYTSDSDVDYIPKPSVPIVEECWDDLPNNEWKNCDPGVTASDNEWRGHEKPVVRIKKSKKKMPIYPDWLFDDASE